MIFRRASGGVLLFAQDVVSTFESFKQAKPEDPEAGGILLGRLLRDSEDVIVDQATPPGESDRRSRTYFVRSLMPAQRKVDAAWASSEGTSNYVGEWHTHPEPHPSPSPHDRRDWRRIAKKARYAQESLFFVIVGTESVRAWECDKTSRSIVELTPITTASASP